MAVKFADILFPTDFSDLAQTAFEYARELTEMFNAQLHCLHVVDEAYQYWSAMGPESIPVGPPPEDLIELARTRIDEYRAEHMSGLKREAITHVRVGRPFLEIIGCARDNDVNVIVMATHGRGAVAQMLLGSTTEKVVRKAGCAVLTVRAGGHQFVMP